MKKILVILFFLSLNTISAQEVGLENWKIYLPYNFATEVELGENEVFCASREGLFSYNQQTNEIKTFSRINGLSDFGISVIKYAPEFGYLLIGYENGNLDIFDGENFRNESAIKNKNITGRKEINHILIMGTDAFLSTGFGIVQYDLQRLEIKDRFIIGAGGTQVQVFSLTASVDSFYAATDQGVMQASVNSGNLADFNNWTLNAQLSARTVKYIQWFEPYLVTGNIGDTLLLFSETARDTFLTTDGGTQQLGIRRNKLYHSNFYRLSLYDENLVNFKTNPVAGMENVRKAVVDESGTVWFADQVLGLVKQENTGNNEVIIPDGPTSTNVHRLRFAKEELLMLAGGYRSTSFSAFFIRDGCLRYRDSEWDVFNADALSGLLGSIDYVDALKFDNGAYFFATWGGGVYLLSSDAKTVTQFDPSNSSLEYVSGTNNLVRVGSMSMDNNGDVWMANTASTKPIVRRKANGDWDSFRAGNLSEVYEIFADSYGQKWVISRGGVLGLLGADNNSFTIIGSTQKLPGAAHSIAEDKDGVIWVGTNAGPALFFSPTQIINGQNPDAFQIKVEEEEKVGYLLGDQRINSIAIDGANRKWFATENGVWLISDDGEEEVYHFTTENSPILSNSVQSIAISPKTGEVFFGTENGLCSFRSTATEGSDTHQEVTVFPNPVRPEYQGLIAVNGLVENALIKITDIAGNLIYQTRALGGQCVWDATNPQGLKVATGVYLVFSTDRDGFETLASKILIVN